MCKHGEKGEFLTPPKLSPPKLLQLYLVVQVGAVESDFLQSVEMMSLLNEQDALIAPHQQPTHIAKVCTLLPLKCPRLTQLTIRFTLVLLLKAPVTSHHIVSVCDIHSILCN